MPEMKRCTKCKIIKDLSSENFYFDKSRQRYKSACNICENKRKMALRNNNLKKYREIEKKSREKHKDSVKVRKKHIMKKTRMQ